MAEVGIDAIEARGVRDGDIGVVHPSHTLCDHHLLFFRGIHVALATNDELGAAHGTISPDFGVVAIVANDQTDLHPLGAFRDVGAIAWIPTFDWCPGHDFSILLNNLTFIIHQDEGVVGRFVWMFFMTFSRQ